MHPTIRRWLPALASALAALGLMTLPPSTAGAAENDNVLTISAAAAGVKTLDDYVKYRDTVTRGATQGAAPAIPPVFCLVGMTMQSRYHPGGRYVSAEIGADYNTSELSGLLRARATTVGDWELFTICHHRDQNFDYIRSQANNLLVTAEFGYSNTDKRDGMLRARSSTLGASEKFIIREGGYFQSKVSPGLYVSVEHGYSGKYDEMLRARAVTPGPWEVFYM